MSLGLGIGISRQGGPLNPDGLSLDLAFALDKTLVARRGPTPTFTRASTATFVGSNGLIQSAAINEPRFDHDPVTGVCRGLLIEESRQNQVLHSANFKNTTSSNFWENLSATTVTVDQTASPDGGVNADLLTTSVTSFDCFTRRNGFHLGSTQYSYSIFLKKGSSNHRFVGLYIGVGISNLQFPFFDFNNPTTVQIPSGTIIGTINSTKVEEYPNDWYRVSITYTTASSPVTGFLGVYISSSNGILLGSNTAGLNAFIWGIQVELGAFPTSYIPTTTAALTRSADVCSISGANFTSFYNQSEGAVLVLSSIQSLGGVNRGLFGIDNNTNSHAFLTFYDILSSGITSQSRNAGNTSLSGNFINFAGVLFKRALTYSFGVCSISTNGGAVANTSVTISTQTMLTMRIGNMLTGSFQGTCHIARLQYFRKHLSNAKLQSLTAL